MAAGGGSLKSQQTLAPWQLCAPTPPPSHPGPSSLRSCSPSSVPWPGVAVRSQALGAPARGSLQCARPSSPAPTAGPPALLLVRPMGGLDVLGSGQKRLQCPSGLPILWIIVAKAGEAGDTLAKERPMPLGGLATLSHLCHLLGVSCSAHQPYKQRLAQESLEILGVLASQPGSIQLGHPGETWPPQPGSLAWGVGTDRPPGWGCA